MATWKELAEKVRSSIDELLAQRKAESDKILAVRSACAAEENRDPSESEANTVRSATAEVERFDERIEDLRAQLKSFEREIDIEELHLEEGKKDKREKSYAPGRVLSEPSVYNPDTAARGASFFKDLYQVQEKNSQDPAVRERFNRYQAEVAVKREERAASTSSFAGLIPPDYLVEDYALIARAGRPFLNSVRGLPLLPEGMQLVIPRGTTGASAAVQGTENSNVSSTDQVWGNLTIPVVSIAGQQDVSRQTLERGTPGIDSIIFSDLAAAYAVAADQQGLNGSGASGQALGLLNTAGIGQSTAFGAAVTAATFYKKVAGAIAYVLTTRLLPPDVIWMHPRRWAWFESQVDANGRPLVVPNAQGPFNAVGVTDAPQNPTGQVPVGNMLGLPVIQDANIPTNVGTNSEDVVIVGRWEDDLLWEDGDGSPTDLTFEQTLGNQLTVKLVAYGYKAFSAGRFPAASAVVGGVDTTAGYGLVTPSF
jgi:HK97 family phage major capsid protein